MEGTNSSEMLSEDKKVSLEKNIKRRYKTPTQVMALEKFYNEHKYPSEEMKLQLAERIGLTEKQVSGWFCHRRIKDKRLTGDEAFAGGTHYRSIGVIQDRGSGLRQDSCGSTKQEDYRSIDPREVESRMLYSHDIPATELPNGRSHYTAHASGRDDTSSESSSFLQDRLYSQIDDPYAIEASRFLRRNEDTHVHRNSAKSKKYKPSGYLKVKCEAENAAINAVKRQLGRNYWEEGPPLGVQFDPLPPGAFESPNGDAINAQPFYVGNSRWSNSPDVPDIEKPHKLGAVKKLCNEKKAMKGIQDHVAEQLKAELPKRDYVAKESYAEIPRWQADQKKGSAELSSFSEDETAETSSSTD